MMRLLITTLITLSITTSQGFQLFGKDSLLTPHANATTASTGTPEHTDSAIISKTMPAVVNLMITLDETDPENQATASKSPEAAGQPRRIAASGVIVNADDGVIITNEHVVHHHGSIMVTLGDGRRFIGDVIGSDPDTDLAVIQIKSDHLTAIRTANDEDIQVGDHVIAMGNPFGLNQTATAGIVSGLHRGVGIEKYEDFIQTDAPINPGNSGGALINESGELVGINTAILATSRGNIGIGFAIPIHVVKSVAHQILNSGHVKHLTFGAMAQDLTPPLADMFDELPLAGHAVLVSDVVADSLAAKAKLKSGDIMTNFNDTPLYNIHQLKALVAIQEPDSTAGFTVKRDGKTLNLSVKMTEQKHQDKSTSALAGLSVARYDSQNEHGKRVQGMLVTDVKQGSSAWLSGLRPADVIVSINHHTTETVKAYDEAIHKKAHDYLIKAMRDGYLFYMTVTA